MGWLGSENTHLSLVSLSDVVDFELYLEFPEPKNWYLYLRVALNTQWNSEVIYCMMYLGLKSLASQVILISASIKLALQGDTVFKLRLWDPSA